MLYSLFKVLPDIFMVLILINPDKDIFADIYYLPSKSTPYS